MVHSSSRPADIPASNRSKASSLSESAIDEVPFEVNVASDLETTLLNDEQLIPSDQAIRLAAPFVKKWNRLISQTNWEKGSIIVEWRTNLIESSVRANAYSDEAWARSVEGVSPQHVGRLRRVYDRFKDSYSSYEGLFWTHFLAALDWSDAELWLEGAVQSTWSVSQMRRTRWEAMGKDPAQQPDESEIITAEADEDFAPLMESEDATETDRELQDRIGTTGPRAEDPDFGEGETAGSAASDAESYEDFEPGSEDGIGDRTSPFVSLPELPVDIADAMEQFKIAIVRHRASHWQDISPATIQQVLDALSTFARSDG